MQIGSTEIGPMEIVTICSALIGVASLVYAIMTNKEKKRFENIVQQNLAGITGNILYAQDSADKSDHNFTRARDEALKLGDGAAKQLILKHIHNGGRDSAAAERLLSALANEVTSMQEGMFGTKIIAHPDRLKLQVEPNDSKETP